MTEVRAGGHHCAHRQVIRSVPGKMRPETFEKKPLCRLRSEPERLT
jgi:hypothetical protein